MSITSFAATVPSHLLPFRDIVSPMPIHYELRNIGYLRNASSLAIKTIGDAFNRSTKSLNADLANLALRRFFLHLPQLHKEQFSDKAAVATIAELSLRRLPISTSTSHLPPDLSLQETELSVVSDSVAWEVHAMRHYLGSARAGDHLGLFVKSSGEPLALATFSVQDVVHLRQLVGEPCCGVAVLSRLYAYPGAPKNTISFFLARATADLRRKNGIEQFLTYLDPNLAFHGASYRAANWKIAGTEPKQPYLYLDNEYLSIRSARSRFGTSRYLELSSKVGSRISKAVQPLDDLIIYRKQVN